MLKPCLVCGMPSPGGHCARHPRLIARRNPQLRARVAASAVVCPECGQAPTPTNPMTAEHGIAQVHGGQDDPGNLSPLCRRCNSRGGAAYVNGGTAWVRRKPA